MLEPGCDFCAEFNGLHGDTFDVLTDSKALSRIVLSSGNLNAVPSLGEILPYHLLVIPRYHVTSVLNLEPTDKPHFAELIRHICRVYKKAFGQLPVLFEHGDPTGKDVFNGQCVSHAHFHILPKNVELLSAVRAECPHLASVPLDQLTSETQESYVAVMDESETLQLFSSSGTPRQYLRALYGRLVDVEGAENWNTRKDGKITTSSAEKLRRLFDNYHD